MVARTPPKQRRVVAPLNPILVRETLRKVDKCMERLQELQYTVAGGRKVISGVSLSPRSTKGYLRTSLRCKQETLRIKSTGSRGSPVGKFPASSGGEWRRMSLPAMLLGETVGEILEASQFARDIVAAVTNKTKKPVDDPKTPLTQQRKHRPNPDKTELRTRRKREKKLTRTESGSPCLQRARSRINFKVSPPKNRETEKENNRYLANRVSPRNRPWAKKTVLFPNPLFLNSPSSKQQKFCKTGSPTVERKIQTPHKFLIKSPPSASKFQVKVKSPPIVSSIPSPTRQTNLSKKSPKLSTASKLRRSLSPSRLATKLVSPLKSRKKELAAAVDGVPTRLKQRPVLVPRRFSTGRI